MIVDGIPQAESTMSTSARSSTGLHNGNINNTEYENISSVKVQKGANSVMNGSGALGGAFLLPPKRLKILSNLTALSASIQNRLYPQK